MNTKERRDEETKIERRVMVNRFEVREAADGEGPTIEGYAAVFDQWSDDLGGFREKIREGAFAQSVKQNDVRALWNHNADYVLGRNQSGTLEMAEDAQGLRVVIAPPDTQWANDLLVSMRRGDVEHMSFGFFTREDAWTQTKDGPRRELIDVDLFDVSVVTYPAYPQTSAEARSKCEQLTAGAADENEPAKEPGPQARQLARRQIEIKKRRLT